MLRFQNPTRPSVGKITIWCERAGAGFQLVQRDPGGSLHAERYQDRLALSKASARLEAALTAAGWRRDERRHGRGRRSRDRQFDG